jgi:predicted lipoprotein with Yx(FWY)xxD motif
MKSTHGILYLAAISFLAAGPAVAASNAKSALPLATPAGITIQPLGLAQGYGLDKTTAAGVQRDKIVFATAEGMTLYTRDADPVGVSQCADECVKTWIPAKVAARAMPVENWSVITRTDGAKQWAFKGKALYTFVEDVDPGSVGGNTPARFGRGPLIGPRGQRSTSIPKDKPMPQGWTVAYFYPASQDNLPPGFAIKEAEDALGLVLVDERQHTLYAHADARKLDACKVSPCSWQPVRAPKIAEAVGDFRPTWGAGGIYQWTYKGKPLFTYAGDLLPGYAEGDGAAPGWEPVRMVKYFVPTNVTLKNTPKLGKVFADGKGMTLYTRDAFIYQSGSGHSLRHGSPIRPAVGRDLKTDPKCKDDCLAQWTPFLAPDDAQANGNWNVYTRPDGKKQWAYQDYALWTFKGDEKPGDIYGNDEYEYYVSHDTSTVVDIGTPYYGPMTMYWIAAHP